MPGEIQAVAEIMKVLFGKQLGAVAPAFGQGGGAPQGGLLGPGVGDSAGDIEGLLGLLNQGPPTTEGGGVTGALAQQPQPISSAPVNPLGTNDAVNALPGVDQELLDMLEQQNQPNFLEGLLGGLFGGR